MTSASFRVPRIGPLLGWFVALLVAAYVFQNLAYVAYGLARMTVPPTGQGFAMALLLAAPFSLATVYWVARRATGDAPRYLGLRAPAPLPALGWAAVAVAVTLGLEVFRRALGEPAVPSFVAEVYETAVWLPLLWLSVGILAPLVEEALFRGFLLPGLAARWGGVAAVAVTAALFSAIHAFQYGWVDLVVVFTLGLVLGAARLRTGSLPLAMALHALVNLLALGHAEWVLGG